MKNMILILAVVLVSTSAIAAEHHSGHGGGNSGSGGTSGHCMKAHLSKFQPAHLETVAPGAEFSFLASNIQKAEQVSVTVKGIPVELSSEFKDPNFVVKGKLPSSLVNTTARVNIKVSAKMAHCEAENGWLLKITE